MELHRVGDHTILKYCAYLRVEADTILQLDVCKIMALQ